MRILFSSVRAAGRLLSMLPLADAAVEAGHEVTFLVYAGMAGYLRPRSLLPAGPDTCRLRPRRVVARPWKVVVARASFASRRQASATGDGSETTWMTAMPPRHHRKHPKGAIIEKLVVLTILVAVVIAIVVICNLSVANDPNAIGLPP